MYKSEVEEFARGGVARRRDMAKTKVPTVMTEAKKSGWEVRGGGGREGAGRGGDLVKWEVARTWEVSRLRGRGRVDKSEVNTEGGEGVTGVEETGWAPFGQEGFSGQHPLIWHRQATMA